MDVCDRAQQLEETARQAALSQRQRETVQPASTGRCLNCEEPLAEGQRFCDPDCRDDYTRLQAKRQNDRIVGGLRG